MECGLFEEFHKVIQSKTTVHEGMLDINPFFATNSTNNVITSVWSNGVDTYSETPGDLFHGKDVFCDGLNPQIP